MPSLKHPVPLNWQDIDTVLLDMDGTILDLSFDNFFWLDYLPTIYAKKNQLSLAQSKQFLAESYGKIEGTLNWYCLDYWSEQLQLDILALKHQVSERIAFRPQAIEFLTFLNTQNKRVIMVTNAHPKSLEIKQLSKKFHHFFAHLNSSHEFGVPKEFQEYWQKLHAKYHIVPERTLFIDDNLRILHSANDYGIKFVLGVAQPDSQRDQVDCHPFYAINNFSDIIGA